MFEPLKLKRSKSAHHYIIQGDKTKQREPEEVHLHFPGGCVSVTRCEDDEHWVHVSFEDEGEDDANRKRAGKLIDARLDCDGIATTDANLGDLSRPDMFHAAFKVKSI